MIQSNKVCEYKVNTETGCAEKNLFCTSFSSHSVILCCLYFCKLLVCLTIMLPVSWEIFRGGIKIPSSILDIDKTCLAGIDSALLNLEGVLTSTKQKIHKNEKVPKF